MQASKMYSRQPDRWVLSGIARPLNTLNLKTLQYPKPDTCLTPKFPHTLKALKSVWQSVCEGAPARAQNAAPQSRRLGP